MRDWLLAGLGVCLALSLSCSGGGGGGGGAVPQQLSISVSTNNLVVEATNLDWVASGTVTITTSGTPSQNLYVGYETTYNAIQSVSLGSQTATTVQIDIVFRAPNLLGIGTYSDTLMLGVATDPAGVNQLINSPQTINVTLKVHLPGPTLTGLSSTSAWAGDPGFTLTATGSNFGAGSVLQWNGSPRPTTVVNATQLTAQIPASDLATPGTAQVTINDGGTNDWDTTSAIIFTINPPALGIGSVTPNPVRANGPAFAMTVNGDLFMAGSTVQWNGNPRPTTFLSSTQLQAQIEASDIATSGTASVTVVNPGPQGGLSNVFTVTIAAPDATALQINPAHTGTIQFQTANLPPSSTWTVNLGGKPSYALIAEGKVFVTVAADSGSSLVALDQATGMTLWGPISIQYFSNATYENGTVFVFQANGVAQTGVMNAYDAATGNLQWSTTIPSDYVFLEGPTAANGMVYVPGEGAGGNLWAIDETTGTIAWSTVVSATISTPAVTQDGLYLADSYQVLDLNPANGATSWDDNPLAGGVGGTPVIANGILYAPIIEAIFETFNAETGALLGNYTADNMPAIDATTGYFLQGGTFDPMYESILQGATLNAIDLGTGNSRWTFSGDGYLASSPIEVNSYVFVGSSQGNLYALDAGSGAQVWTVNLGAAIPKGEGYFSGMPWQGLSAGDGLLVVPAGNTLTAFVLSTNP